MTVAAPTARRVRDSPGTRQRTRGLITVYFSCTLHGTGRWGAIQSTRTEITFWFLSQLRLAIIDHVVTLFNCHRCPDQGSFWCFLLLASLFLHFFTYGRFCGFTSCVVSELWAQDLEKGSPIPLAFVTFPRKDETAWPLSGQWASSPLRPRKSHYPAERCRHVSEEPGQLARGGGTSCVPGPCLSSLRDLGQVIWSPPSSVSWWTLCPLSWVAQRPPETPGSSRGLRTVWVLAFWILLKEKAESTSDRPNFLR